METPESNPVGYLWLAEHFGVVTMPHWRESRVLVKGTRRLVETDRRQVEYLPAAQNPEEIKVETSVSRRPPRRSRRAELPHRAPQECALVELRS